MPSKEREQYYLDCLIERRPELFAGRVEPSEAPDFMVESPRGIIGIEVTEFSTPTVRGLPHAVEQASLRELVMSLARVGYEQLGGPTLHVNVLFAQHSVLTKKRAYALATELAEFLSASSSQLLWYSQSRFLDDTITDVFPEIVGITAVRVPDVSYSAWVTGDGGWVCHAGQDELRRVVEAKERKAPVYRAKCRFAWLLVAFDLYAAGDVIHSPTEPVDFILATSFDRVFCLTVVTRHVVEIPCRRRE